MMCTVDGCDRPVHVKKRGFCKMHWTRWSRHGDPTVVKQARRSDGPSYCNVAGCSRLVNAHGMCAGHYNRMVTYGDTFPDVPLRRGGALLKQALAEPEMPPSCVDCGGGRECGMLRCLPCAMADIWRRREARSRAAAKRNRRAA